MTTRVTGTTGGIQAPSPGPRGLQAGGGAGPSLATDRLELSPALDEELIAATHAEVQALKEKVEAVEAARQSRSKFAVAGLGASAVAAWAGLTESARLAELARSVELATSGVQNGRDLLSENKGLREHLTAFREARAKGERYRPGMAPVESLSRLGKVTASLDVVRGGMAAVGVAGLMLDLAREPGRLSEKRTWDRLGAGVLDAMTGATAGLRLAGVASNVVARMNPVLGLSAGGLGLSRVVDDISKEGLTLGRGVEMTRHGLALTGHALMLVPGGQLASVACKTASLGLELIQFGADNHAELRQGGVAAVDLAKRVGRRAGDLARDPGTVSRDLAQSLTEDAGKVGRHAAAQAERLQRLAVRMKDALFGGEGPDRALRPLRLPA
ncbi:MAG: hypothetical protein VKO21_06965 [Candidatus Sericytochromatia bacterium]|nr:hypothetical protein [Candidatus Sericytochromatia bacterium]